MLHAASKFAIHTMFGHIPVIATAVFVGYIAHLFSDSMTIQPVPWPWPLKIGGQQGRWWVIPVKTMRVRTGSDFEKHVIRRIVSAFAVLVFLGAVIVPPLVSSFNSQSKTKIEITHNGKKTHSGR
jgi:membrane-bound metal-dependent hydrolase YbcI (DUF457 family)